MTKHFIEKEEKDLIEKFQKNGILTNDLKCYFYCDKLVLVGRKRKNSYERVIPSFRCSNSFCQKFQSVYRNSFFSLFRTPMMLVVEIIKHWCANIIISKTLDLFKIHGKIRL